MTIVESPQYRRYFNWLYDQVFPVRDIESPLSYSVVASHMHSITFKDLVPNDHNRAADGTALRDEFLEAATRNPVSDVSPSYPDASIFEVLVAFSKRLEFNLNITQQQWFEMWTRNLGLHRYSDEYCIRRSNSKISKILEKFNDREYEYDGKGGIFPLRYPERDQRKVELWYQMSAYWAENFRVT